jgi:hypothetical protein
MTDGDQDSISNVEILSKDDYDIALESGVEDESLLESPGATKFSISSYGADYTVDTLVKRMNAGAFLIPDFQRKFVWTLSHASKFIESLLMGLPVPGIFLYKVADTNEHLVIDGQQRLRTLQAFYSGMFRDKKFRLVGVREPWNGKSYDELDTADILKLDDSIVHATIFKQDQPKDVLDSIYFVFERINSGGIRLSPQEIRNCISLGPFIKLIRELNLNEDWRAVFGRMNNRSKDEELILRFLALYFSSENYSRPMNKFLNDFADETNSLSTSDMKRLGEVFTKTISKVRSAIGSRAFRLVRALNAAVFDAVMVGLARRLQRGDVSNEAVSAAYDRLVSDPEFRAACERATADEENVKKRLEIATSVFSRA